MRPLRRKRAEISESDDNEWLNTYADCITLLLCFFVILFSLSEPKIGKLEEVSEGFASGFLNDMIELPFKTLYDDFQLMIVDNAVELEVAAEATSRGVRLDLAGESLFASGTVTLKPAAKALLIQTLQLIKQRDLPNYQLEVEGHSDDIPLSAGAAAVDNWQLSALRAASVIRFLQQEGIPASRLSLHAYGETRPQVPNRDAMNNPIPENQARNRRIVLHVVRGK